MIQPLVAQKLGLAVQIDLFSRESSVPNCGFNQQRRQTWSTSWGISKDAW